MHAEDLLGALAFAFFLSGVFLAAYIRRTKVVHVTDFQTGLRFKKGESYELLPQGSYRTSTGRAPITVVDMRPRQFIIERIIFQDALLANSVISIGAELLVSDPEVANNKLKNLFDDSLVIVREHLCPAATRSVIDPSPKGKEKLATTITSEINSALQSSGMMIRNLEITELWVQHPELTAQTTAN